MTNHKELGEQVDVCDVCGVPIEDAQTVIMEEYLNKVLTFCSEKCFQEYIESPEAYAEFENDEDLD